MIKIMMAFQWLVPLSVLMSCYGLSADNKPAIKTSDVEAIPAKGIAVIELFTSEGCSSCPSADRLVTKIAAEKMEQVYVLSYHVDYWDYLGWKDPFSQAAFSDRQRYYAQKFSLESSYTPQVVVNGVDEFVGSDEPKLRSSIEKNSTVTPIVIDVKRKDETTVEVSYKLPVNEPVLLNVALVQPEATTSVKRGENGGRTLHHINIVRQLKTLAPTGSTGTVQLQIPAELKETAFEVIAFTQQKSGTKITGAAQVTLPAKHT